MRRIFNKYKNDDCKYRMNSVEEQIDSKFNSLNYLNKKNTSKSLPMLPDEVKNKIEIVNQKNDVEAKFNCPPIILNDEDEIGTDYDYDYVCLESKKKLDAEDEKIKLLLVKRLQSTYENLVFNSSDNRETLSISSNHPEMAKKRDNFYR